jgi:hypothetical protein
MYDLLDVLTWLCLRSDKALHMVFSKWQISCASSDAWSFCLCCEGPCVSSRSFAPVCLGSHACNALGSFFIPAGAAKLTTIEYARIESHVKNLEAMTPREWAAGWLNRTLPQPDFLFSFSSLEHDGLARYGDPLNPWGDVESMHRMSCYLKPGGLLYLNVPTYSRDMLFWNAHRVYSTARYPLLTSNWKVTAVFSADADLGGCAGNSCAALWEHIKDETHPLAPGIVVVLSNQQPTACQGG